MVGNSWLSPVNRQSFVRSALHECSRKPRGTKMIRFPPSPRDRPEPLATKPAHLLRLTRYPRPYPLFMKNRRRSTCGYVLAFFSMVGGKGLDVVDGPISWRALLPNAQKRRHGGGRCLRGGWGWGWGYVLAPRRPPGAFWPRALSTCLALTDTPDQGSDAGHGDDKCHKQSGSLLVACGG